MVLAVFVMYVILGDPVRELSASDHRALDVADRDGGRACSRFLFGEEASLYAFIGLFMLMGIVKKNGIMIVDFAIQRVADGETAEKAIHEASMDRFRPILMTTMAAIMGAVPIAMGFGADGEAPAAGSGHRRRVDREPVHHALRHAGDLSVSGSLQEKVLGRWNAWRARRRPDLVEGLAGPRPFPCGGRWAGQWRPRERALIGSVIGRSLGASGLRQTQPRFL